MALSDTTETLANIIPVVVTSGIVLKATESIFGKKSKRPSGKKNGKRSKRHYEPGFGDFSNVRF